MADIKKLAQRRESKSEAKNLGTFLNEIVDDPTDCKVVTKTIDPNNYDATALLLNMERKNDYSAVYFENPLDMYAKPSDFGLCMNLFATRERCAAGVGIPRSHAGEGLGAEFAALVKKAIQPETITSDNAPVQANVLRGEDADMWKLPAVRHSDMDLNAVFTMTLAMKAPDEDFYNITFVKVFPETGRRGGLTIHSPDMSRMMRLWRAKGERVRTIAILGHHPGFWLGTTNSTPYGDNEYATAGAFLGEPVRLAPSVTWGDEFLVPADAEIIIEGEISADEKTIVNPFGESTTIYQPQELAPLLEVTAITHRDNAILQDVFSGHSEHWLLGSIGREGAIYNFLQKKYGCIRAVHVPGSGTGRHIVYVSIKKTSEQQPNQIALDTTAFVGGIEKVVVVDDDIDVFREEEVVWAMHTFVIPGRDFNTIKNYRGVVDMRGTDTMRIIIDATKPTHIVFPKKMKILPEHLERMQPEEWVDSSFGKA